MVQEKKTGLAASSVFFVHNYSDLVSPQIYVTKKGYGPVTKVMFAGLCDC